MREVDVLLALSKHRFSPPAWAFMTGVRNRTGYEAATTADAVAMSLYPSRGLDLHGIEVKVSRGDWLRELRKPAKSVPVQSQCDYWWVAVPDRKIVEKGELPPTWGLLHVTARKVATVVKAPSLREERGPIARGFLGALLRRSLTGLEVAERALEEARREAADQARQTVEKHQDWEKEHELRTLKMQVAEFERRSGLDITSYNFGRIADFAKQLMDGGFPQLGPRGALATLLHDAKRMQESAQRAEARAKEQVEALERVMAQVKRVATDGAG